MAISAVAIEIVTFEFIILAIVCFFLLRYYRGKMVKFDVAVSVYASWVLGFAGILLLPYDLSIALVDEYSSTVLRNVWQMVYWSTFFLAWVVLPLQMEFHNSGHFTRKEKMWDALRKTIYAVTIVIIAGIGYMFYMIASGSGTLEQILAFTMAMGNTYGILIITVLMGNGLVSMPMRLWMMAERDRELARLYILANGVEEEYNDARFELEDCEQAVSRLTELVDREGLSNSETALALSREIGDYVAELSKSVSNFEFSGRSSSLMHVSKHAPTINIGEYTKASMVELHARLLRAQMRAQGCERRWRNLVLQCRDLEVLLFGQYSSALLEQQQQDNLSNSSYGINTSHSASSHNFPRKNNAGSPKSMGSSTQSAGGGITGLREAGGGSWNTMKTKGSTAVGINNNSNVKNSVDGVAQIVAGGGELGSTCVPKSVFGYTYNSLDNGVNSSSPSSCISLVSYLCCGGLLSEIMHRFWMSDELYYAVCRSGAVLCGLASMLILWCELMMSASFESPLGLIMGAYRYEAQNSVWIQTVSFLALAYMSICTYWSLFRINIGWSFKLQGPQQSPPSSLIFNGEYFSRLQFALGYNFLLCLNVSRTSLTAFDSLMSGMQLIPVFGTSFTVYMPIVMILIAAMTLVDGFSRILRFLGVDSEVNTIGTLRRRLRCCRKQRMSLSDTAAFLRSQQLLGIGTINNPLHAAQQKNINNIDDDDLVSIELSSFGGGEKVAEGRTTTTAAATTVATAAVVTNADPHAILYEDLSTEEIAKLDSGLSLVAAEMRRLGMLPAALGARIARIEGKKRSDRMRADPDRWVGRGRDRRRGEESDDDDEEEGEGRATYSKYSSRLAASRQQLGERDERGQYGGLSRTGGIGRRGGDEEGEGEDGGGDYYGKDIIRKNHGASSSWMEGGRFTPLSISRTTSATASSKESSRAGSRTSSSSSIGGSSSSSISGGGGGGGKEGYPRSSSPPTLSSQASVLSAAAGAATASARTYLGGRFFGGAPPPAVAAATASLSSAGDSGINKNTNSYNYSSSITGGSSSFSDIGGGESRLGGGGRGGSGVGERDLFSLAGDTDGDSLYRGRYAD